MDNNNPMADGIPVSKQLYSIGMLCQLLQKVPAQIEAMAAAAGVEPCLYMDAIPMYSGEAVVTMNEHIARYLAECAAAGGN